MQRWYRWKAEEEELKAKAEEQTREHERQLDAERDAQRDSDFADAVDKVARAGYKGRHGNFEVPASERARMEACWRQVTYGDYSETQTDKGDEECVKEWRALKG